MATMATPKQTVALFESYAFGQSSEFMNEAWLSWNGGYLQKNMCFAVGLFSSWAKILHLIFRGSNTLPDKMLPLRSMSSLRLLKQFPVSFIRSSAVVARPITTTAVNLVKESKYSVTEFPSVLFVDLRLTLRLKFCLQLKSRRMVIRLLSKQCQLNLIARSIWWKCPRKIWAHINSAMPVHSVASI